MRVSGVEKNKAIQAASRRRLGRPLDANYLLSAVSGKKEKIRLSCRRMSALLGALMFVGIYLYVGVLHGLLVAIAVGWLPSAVVAWLVAKLFLASSDWVLQNT